MPLTIGQLVALPGLAPVSCRSPFTGGLTDVRNVPSASSTSAAQPALVASARAMLKSAYVGICNLWSRSGQTQTRRASDAVALDAWATSGAPDENRSVAAARVAVLSPSAASLDLARLGLRQLPPLPDYLQALDVRGNALTLLPALPAQLTVLVCSDNPLSRLPALPVTLRELVISNTPVQALPTLPLALEILLARNCGLATAPPQWPPGLKTLGLSYNCLESIPTLPLTLQQCDLAGNRLAWLPPGAWGLPNLTTPLLVAGNLLSGADPGVQAPPRPLAQAVSHWYGAERRAHVQARWSAFQSEPEAGPFSQFLDKLLGSINVRSAALREGFVASVAHWLDDLAQCPDLRADAFALAAHANATCEDRATLSFLHMALQRLNRHVAQGQYDHDPSLLLSQARGVMCQQALERIAVDKVAALTAEDGYCDDVEVVLAYYIKLARPLNLPLPTQLMDMRFPARVSAADLGAAAQQIGTGDLRQFLSSWEPWKQVLVRFDAAKVHAADAAIAALTADAEIFGEHVREHIRTQFNQSDEWPVDEDMLRAAAPIVMARIQHRFYAPITQAYLAAHGLLLPQGAAPVVA